MDAGLIISAHRAERPSPLGPATYPLQQPSRRAKAPDQRATPLSAQQTLSLLVRHRPLTPLSPAPNSQLPGQLPPNTQAPTRLPKMGAGMDREHQENRQTEGLQTV